MTYDWEKDWQMLRKQELDVIKQAQKEYKTLVNLYVSVASSNAPESYKIEQIRDITYRLKQYNQKLADIMPKIYTQNINKAYQILEIDTQNPTTLQSNDMNAMRDQFLAELQARANMIEAKALEVVQQGKINAIKESMGIATAPLKSEFVFRTSNGRRYSLDNYLGFVVGNTVNENQQAGRNTTWVEKGYVIGTFQAILDDRTTPICRNLDGQTVDLEKDYDKIPPIAGHRCRSYIRIDLNQKPRLR
jgi:hypothetical protein